MEKAVVKRRRAREAPPAPHKTAYLHFCQSRREAVAAEYSSWPVQKVTAELARQWKVLTASERKPWVELAQFDKARFRNEAFQYVEQRKAEEQPARLRVPFKRKKNANEPRQPDTAYICFWKSRRLEVIAANPTMAAPLVSKEVGRQWKALSAADRQVWVEMAAKDKLRFQEEIARLHPDLAKTPEIPSSLKVPLKDPFAPKPAKTAFQLFMEHNRESFTLLSMTLNEFRSEMSQLWKRLSDADKSAWYEMAKRDQLRHQTEMNSYKPPAYMCSALARGDKRVEDLKRLAREDDFAPRLPLSAYSFYLAAELHKVQERLPGLKHNEIMREMGVTWKTMGNDKRSPYQQQAERDVERFCIEMETHIAEQKPGQPAECLERSKVRKRKKHGQAEVPSEENVNQEHGRPSFTQRKRKLVPPRRPKTAYNLMYMSKRAELLSTYQMSHNECSALCGRLWRDMSEKEKEPYKSMAAEDKRRYHAELKLFNAQAPRADPSDARSGPDISQSDDTDTIHGEVDALWQAISKPQQMSWSEIADSIHNKSSSGAPVSTTQDERHTVEESARITVAACGLQAPIERNQKQLSSTAKKLEQNTADLHELSWMTSAAPGRDELSQRDSIGADAVDFGGLL